MRASAPTKNQMNYSALSCLTFANVTLHIVFAVVFAVLQGNPNQHPLTLTLIHPSLSIDSVVAMINSPSGQQGFIGTWVQFQERSRHPYINWNLCWLAQPLTQSTIAL